MLTPRLALLLVLLIVAAILAPRIADGITHRAESKRANQCAAYGIGCDR